MILAFQQAIGRLKHGEKQTKRGVSAKTGNLGLGGALPRRRYACPVGFPLDSERLNAQFQFREPGWDCKVAGQY
ncbi:MAG: hypothetical protein RLZZ350_2000 [Verrucomicrobiota bacterium]|jgi:hypothetical protein